MTAHNNVTTRVPVICTRGIVVFPGLDVMIEVGRQKSINAVNEARLCDVRGSNEGEDEADRDQFEPRPPTAPERGCPCVFSYCCHIP